jgi:hypothetical protein
VKNSIFHDTGILRPEYGEGIYIGGWTKDGLSRDFGVTDNQVLHNHFGPNVRAEGVDVKEGADRTLIRGNFFDGTGTAYINYQTTSLIAVIANSVTIDSNYMQNGDPHGVSFLKPAGTMSGNNATANTIDLRDIHNYGVNAYGFQFQLGTAGGATVRCDNVMRSGKLSNVACTP